MTPTPHDALFKSTFSNPRRAMSLVRATLPYEVTRHLDASTARLAPGTFIDATLKERYSDLLFEVRLAGRTAFVYLLLEHQSTSDALMPYRMLQYMLGIWQRWQGENPAATRLPVVLPLVISHVPDGWRGASSMSDLFDLDAQGLADLSPWLPAFRIAVDDLAEQDDHALRTRAADALTRLVLLALKHARSAADIEPILLEWMELMQQVVDTPRGIDAIIKVMRYLYLVTPLTSERALKIVEVGKVGVRVKEAIMTGAERMHEKGVQEGLKKGLKKGMEKGLQEGLEKGLQEGLEKGQRATFVALVASLFGEVPAPAAKKIEEASSADIDRWIAGIKRATTLEELLAG